MLVSIEPTNADVDFINPNIDCNVKTLSNHFNLLDADTLDPNDESNDPNVEFNDHKIEIKDQSTDKNQWR